MGKGSFKHGIRGYKDHKCRCDICTTAYTNTKIRESLKNRKARIKHQMIDGILMAEFYKKCINSRLDTSQRRLIKRWEEKGVSVYEADKYCIKFGYHPYEVFGEAYFDGLDDEIAEYQKIFGENADV